MPTSAALRGHVYCFTRSSIGVALALLDHSISAKEDFDVGLYLQGTVASLISLQR